MSPEQLAEQLDAHDGTRALRRVDAGVASLRERLAVHALGITRLRGLGFCLAPIGWAP